MRVFEDRKEAGQRLADALEEDYAARDDLLVLALPRGGVPVAWEIAQRLHAPLDVFIVRKLGTPGQPELAMGAIASGGIRVLNRQIVDTLGISEETIEAVAAREQAEIERREHQYRQGRAALQVADKTVILVDDGIATGATVRAAINAVRQLGPRHLVLAVPHAAPQACELIQTEVDRLVCLETPEPYIAVGYWYNNFSQTSDEQVQRLLRADAVQAAKVNGSND